MFAIAVHTDVLLWLTAMPFESASFRRGGSFMDTALVHCHAL